MQLTWGQHWLEAFSLGHVGKRLEWHKWQRFVNMKWGLNQQSCGLLCLHRGFWHQLAWTRVGEISMSNRAVCCAVKIVGVLLLRFKGFSSPDIREQWRYDGVQVEKAEKRSP